MSDTPITDDMDPQVVFGHHVMREAIMFLDEQPGRLEGHSDMDNLEEFGNWLANKFLNEPDIFGPNDPPQQGPGRSQ